MQSCFVEWGWDRIRCGAKRTDFAETAGQIAVESAWEGWVKLGKCMAIEYATLARLAFETTTWPILGSMPGGETEPMARGAAKSHRYVYITEEKCDSLWTLDPVLGVKVSTWQSGGLCLYSGIKLEMYLLLCSLLGLTQWRALARNTLLKIEDFGHERPSTCLFAPQDIKQDFAHLLERPHLCKGCWDFYYCLGVEYEMFALKHVVESIRACQVSGTKRTRITAG